MIRGYHETPSMFPTDYSVTRRAYPIPDFQDLKNLRWVGANMVSDGLGDCLALCEMPFRLSLVSFSIVQRLV